MSLYTVLVLESVVLLALALAFEGDVEFYLMLLVAADFFYNLYTFTMDVLRHPRLDQRQ
jgi:hypothetical protein